jgi:hypothetical protein
MSSLSRTRVFEWYARYRDGRENLEGDERSGRQTAVRTPDMIKRVRQLIPTDRRMTLWKMEKDVLSRLVQRIREVRPLFEERGSWFLLHDNARPHTAVSIKQFLAKQPPLWSSGQSFWLQIQGSRARFPALPDFLRSSGSGTGSTQPRENNWEAT